MESKAQRGKRFFFASRYPASNLSIKNFVAPERSQRHFVSLNGNPEGGGVEKEGGERAPLQPTAVRGMKGRALLACKLKCCHLNANKTEEYGGDEGVWDPSTGIDRSQWRGASRGQRKILHTDVFDGFMLFLLFIFFSVTIANGFMGF